MQWDDWRGSFKSPIPVNVDQAAFQTIMARRRPAQDGRCRQTKLLPHASLLCNQNHLCGVDTSKSWKTAVAKAGIRPWSESSNRRQATA